MKLRISNLYTAMALAATLSLCHALAEDKPSASDAKAGKPKEGDAPNMAEMMKNMEAAATPGPAHKVLDSLAGEWNITARFWMAGPDGPPMESKGTVTSRWVLGGRFLQEEVSSEMMGKPFQGMGLTGYDNMKKKYVNVWADSMGTSLTTCQGSADAAGKVITYEGKMDEPMTGEKDKPFKYILRIESPDKHILEMHDPTRGEKSKMGEITYTRK